MDIRSVLKDKVIAIYNKEIYKHETKVVNSVLQNEDFRPIINQTPIEREKVAIVVGSIVRFSGGHTSMLRMGTGLEERGKSVTYISFNNQSKENMQENALGNLPHVKGEFLRLKDADLDAYDIIIATSWQSVYYVKKFSGYRMYFVQDYEPYFFKLSERYLLAKKTYELGLHIVSLGKWNIEQIKKNCRVLTNAKYDYVSFPYEPSEYRLKERDYDTYKGKRKIRLAVYAKEDGKRIPNMLQSILRNVAYRLQADGIELDICFFGFNKDVKVQIGHNYGKLNHKEMQELYNKSDFGMVASMTNISLVPYEMLATGLPIIEFEEGSFPFFFPENTAIIVNFNYQILADELIRCLDSPVIIKERMQRAREYLMTLSWTNTCDEFNSIIDNV